MEQTDPFAGWEMASVGCYWSRKLGDGTHAYLSSWTSPHRPSEPGYRSGYRLTSHGASRDYETLDDALAGFDALELFYGKV